MNRAGRIDSQYKGKDNISIKCLWKFGDIPGKKAAMRMKTTYKPKTMMVKERSTLFQSLTVMKNAK